MNARLTESDIKRFNTREACQAFIADNKLAAAWVHVTGRDFIAVEIIDGRVFGIISATAAVRLSDW